MPNQNSTDDNNNIALVKQFLDRGQEDINFCKQSNFVRHHTVYGVMKISSASIYALSHTFQIVYFVTTNNKKKTSSYDSMSAYDGPSSN